MRLTVLVTAMTGVGALWCGGPALAQIAPLAEPSAEVAAITGGAQVKPAATVDECWSAWLSQQTQPDGSHVRLGPNLKPDGSSTFLATSSFPVRAAKGTPAWVAARTAAFTQAELGALSQMATYIGTELRSTRSASMFKAGDSAPPPDLAPIVAAVSNAQKLTTLTGLALDEAIRQYDPTWNGAGVTEEQRRQRAVTEQNAALEQIEARAAVIAAGAFTISQCEGNNDEGQYAVQTGLIWSPKLAEIAQAIYDPHVTIKAEPAKTALEDQLNAQTAKDPDWMAYTQGARVYTDEHGERVVIGFGVASGSSVAAADVAQARLRAMAAIQRFVGEKIEASAEDKDQFASRTLASGRSQIFDSSAFTQRIEAKARDLRLSGAYEIRTWRGKHPWGQAPMQVVAMAWSPPSSASAASLGSELAKSARSAARTDGASGTAQTPSATGVGTSPSAAPVKSGVSGSVSGF